MSTEYKEAKGAAGVNARKKKVKIKADRYLFMTEINPVQNVEKLKTLVEKLI